METLLNTIQPSGRLFTGMVQQQSSQPKDYHNYNNDLPALQTTGDFDKLSDLATDLGINFDKTGYTFCVRKASGTREMAVYGPSVQAGTHGRPVLCWGYQQVELDDLACGWELVELNKRSYIELDTENFGPLHLSIQLIYGKDNKPVGNLLQLAKAFNSGTVTGYVREAYIQAIAMGDVEPGEYSITALGKAYGKPALQLDTGEWVKASGTVAGQLMDLSDDAIVGSTLLVREPLGKTDKGYNIADAVVLFEGGEDITTEVLDFAFAA